MAIPSSYASLSTPAKAADAPMECQQTPVAARSDVGRPPAWLLERALLALILVPALLVRLVGLGDIEPNVSSVEVAHLATLETVLAGHGSLLGRSDAGATGLALLPAAALRVVQPEPDLALRVYAALGGAALVALFAVVSRRLLPPFAALGATVLLAFCPWSLVLSRNGDLSVFVALFALGAGWCFERARTSVPSTSRVWWMATGVLAALGWYWHPSALWVLPALLAALVLRAAWGGERRAATVSGALLLLLAYALAIAPLAPALVANGGAQAPLLDDRGSLPAHSATPSLPARLQQTVRAFLILEPASGGQARYLAPGRAPLDGLVGVLFLIGLMRSIWRPMPWLSWLSLLVIPLVGSQLQSSGVPDLGRAAVAEPALFVVVGVGLAWLLLVLPARPVGQALILVAVPAYIVASWQGYAGWIGSPASAQARQPAMGYDEVDAWQASQRQRLAEGKSAQLADAWREEHPRVSTVGRAPRRPSAGAAASGAASPRRLGLEPLARLQAPQAPRGLATLPDGTLVVADQTARLVQLSAGQTTLVPFPRPGPPGLDLIWDITTDDDGFIYLADADRSLILKLDRQAGLVATLGAEWGMYRPRGLAFGPDGNLYVADTGRSRVVIGTSDGRLLKSIGPQTAGEALEQPSDVAVDASGRIYVAMPEIGRLVVLDGDGQLLGGWSIPRGDTIESPHLATVQDGVIALTDPVQRQVRLIDADGREIATAPAPGRPFSVAAAGDRLYVGDPSDRQLLIFDLGG
ncbi:MAG: NHL repeat-containing protein [Chloroflexi bacterium]|nr:NHL repeat-containing protein [Chloroflexota bacterium]